MPWSCPESCATTRMTWKMFRCTPWCCPTTRSTPVSPASPVSCQELTCPSGRMPPTTLPHPHSTDSESRHTMLHTRYNPSFHFGALFQSDMRLLAWTGLPDFEKYVLLKILLLNFAIIS